MIHGLSIVCQPHFRTNNGQLTFSHKFRCLFSISTKWILHIWKCVLILSRTLFSFGEWNIESNAMEWHKSLAFIYWWIEWRDSEIDWINCAGNEFIFFAWRKTQTRYDIWLLILNEHQKMLTCKCLRFCLFSVHSHTVSRDFYLSAERELYSCKFPAENSNWNETEITWWKSWKNGTSKW